MHSENIRKMYQTVASGRGFDVIIIVSSNADQAAYWQHRLEASRSSIIGNDTKVISVEEDWPGGAGQFLGTLYAWEKSKSRINLDQVLQNRGAVAMYHTAGKGMRMAPLPAAEANNKSAVKLPRLIDIDGRKVPLTLLEAVIFQTGIFAESRAERLCVFWGDQVFIPSKPVAFGGGYHAEILDIREPIPSDEETWQKEWQSYGLLIPDGRGSVLQREKQTWSDLMGLMKMGIGRPDYSGRVIMGKSLGCFSVSDALLSDLMVEFSSELTQRQSKMDTDPHLWMPLTSSCEEFISTGGDQALWARIDQFKQQFITQHGQSLSLLGDRDLGADTLWWDYGQLHLYHQNFMKALDDSPEGECIRQFYDLRKYWIRGTDSYGLRVKNSIMLDSRVRGVVRNSVLVGVDSDDLDVSDSVIINSYTPGVKANNTLVYTCGDLTNVKLVSGEVLADVPLNNEGLVRMKTGLSRDGKQDWEDVICDNPYSFAQLSEMVEDERSKQHCCPKSVEFG